MVGDFLWNVLFQKKEKKKKEQTKNKQQNKKCGNEEDCFWWYGEPPWDKDGRHTTSVCCVVESSSRHGHGSNKWNVNQVKHWKGESCQMVFGSCPSRVLHISLGKAIVPKTCGYTVPWVVEVVGFLCSHRGGVGPSVEVAGKDDDSRLQASSPALHSCIIALVIIWKKSRYMLL